MTAFSIEKLSYSYGAERILNNISFTVKEGDCFGIIGPNGSGKSTLIHCLSGLFFPQEGNILFQGKPLGGYKKKELAQKIAVLEQNELPLLSFTVEQIVAMGRYPWLKPLKDLDQEDREIIKTVMLELDLWDKRDKIYNTLSGGQRQLVSLARAMVQQPEVLILDEPTTFLDMGHQLLVMEHVRNWHKAGRTVIMVLHDLNLAGQYCHQLLLLDEGEICLWGPVGDVLNHQVISRVYNTSLVEVAHPTLGVPQFLLGR